MANRHALPDNCSKLFLKQAWIATRPAGSSTLAGAFQFGQLALPHFGRIAPRVVRDAFGPRNEVAVRSVLGWRERWPLRIANRRLGGVNPHVFGLRWVFVDRH